eukprot:SAG31_NODE_26061_length_449_cov_0.882857_2_plen_74_part_01
MIQGGCNRTLLAVLQTLFVLSGIVGIMPLWWAFIQYRVANGPGYANSNVEPGAVTISELCIRCSQLASVTSEPP